MPKRTSNLLLFGGGVDSACLGAFLKETSTPFDLLFIDYRQKAVVGEFEAAAYFSDEFDCLLHCVRTDTYQHSNNPILNGKMAKEHNKNVLPIRNQLFLTLGTIFALENGYENIFIGYHQEPIDTAFKDATPAFLDAYNTMLTLQEVKVEVKAPFAYMAQKEYLHYATKPQLAKTFSCYESKTEEECGRCTHCQRKRDLFAGLNAD